MKIKFKYLLGVLLGPLLGCGTVPVTSGVNDSPPSVRRIQEGAASTRNKELLTPEAKSNAERLATRKQLGFSESKIRQINDLMEYINDTCADADFVFPLPRSGPGVTPMGMGPLRVTFAGEDVVFTLGVSPRKLHLAFSSYGLIQGKAASNNTGIESSVKTFTQDGLLITKPLPDASLEITIVTVSLQFVNSQMESDKTLFNAFMKKGKAKVVVEALSSLFGLLSS